MFRGLPFGTPLYTWSHAKLILFEKVGAIMFWVDNFLPSMTIRIQLYFTIYINFFNINESNVIFSKPACFYSAVTETETIICEQPNFQVFHLL